MSLGNEHGMKGGPRYFNSQMNEIETVAVDIDSDAAELQTNEEKKIEFDEEVSKPTHHSPAIEQYEIELEKQLIREEIGSRILQFLRSKGASFAVKGLLRKGFSMKSGASSVPEEIKASFITEHGRSMEQYKKIIAYYQQTK